MTRRADAEHDVPDWVEPMAATLTDRRFVGPEWIFERKFDGIRLLAFKRGADVRLLSRNRLPQESAYPSVVAALARLPLDDAILDGEGMGVWGGSGPEAYYIFDAIRLDGCDLTTLTLDERRARLDALHLAPPLHLVARLDGDQPWDRACREGWEGVIAKRRDSRYEHRRSPHWLKMKCEEAQEFIVGGFTDPQGARVGLGALLIGHYEGDDLVFAGKVGTGFDAALLRELRAELDRAEIASSPFTGATGLPRVRAHWVRPELVVQVAFLEWTVHGKLRHARLLGIRRDKSPRDVVRERP